MPIFYDVDLSQVRKREENFGEAYAKQEVKNGMKAELWRITLVNASNMAGWEPHCQQMLNTSMASSSSSSHAAPASSSRSWKYDVFLSFRGEDTRKTFVDHLCHALEERHICVYKDDATLPRGNSIGPSLFKAIKESHIAVIVFSKNYADSSWCLDELSYIMKCRDEIGLLVMPIFYGMDPSEVRNHKRKCGETFAKKEEENNTKAELWRNALVDASNIAGWEPKNIFGGHESKVIKEIVDTILDKLLPLNWDVDEELVGMMTRLQDLISQLKLGSDDVRMVGIWGVGGGGKTTLATSVYMKISQHFQGHCIVENIREEYKKIGLRNLQQKFLSNVFEKEVKVQSLDEGKHKIKSMLCGRKVLVVLDDVDDLCQLEALAGSHHWFGSGSRIIITTRDQHVLTKVDAVCPVRLLAHDEAMWLFNKHAYNKKDPVKDYEKLSLHVVTYAAGLPLALKVLGSFLYDKDENEWRSALAKLKEIPDLRILDILRISYDGLEALEKELFLDIACFLRGKSTDDAIERLDACGFHPVIGIKVLRQKALITISDGKLDMHDLVQEMGHYIVRGEHPKNPEKHSRVWKIQEINNMCLGDATKDNDNIEAIEYHDYNRDHSSRFFKIISIMKKLRSLWVDYYYYDAEYSEGPNFLSNELRYFYWKRYPASPIFPDSFHAMNLLVLKLEESLQIELWKGYKCLPHLKVLELCYMKNLLSTPDFDGLPCLQKLTVRMCNELEEIHPSLRNLKSLEYINVKDCWKLRRFPQIAQMKKLKTLIIDCTSIVELPEIQANMESLENLCLSRNWIKGRHQLTRILRKLDLSILRKLDLGSLFLKDGEVPSEIGELSNLQELDLVYNSFTRLDFSLSRLTQLKLLRLTNCERLVELPELPLSIAILEADWCESLTTIGNCDTNFKWLCKVSLLKGGNIIDGGRLLQSLLQGRAIENHCMVLRCEGLEIPKRFTPCLVRGNTCTLQLLENWCNDFCGFLVCAVLTKDLMPWENIITMKQVMSGGICMDSQQDVPWKESDTDKTTWVGYVSFDLLRDTAWWDDTYSTVAFSYDTHDACSGFMVGLVHRKNGSDSPTETTHSTEFSRYTPKVSIVHDSMYALEICLSMY